jgi:hypothetical protein
MGEIYCLFSSEDGEPRYVGSTEFSSDKRWKRHLADALEKRPGSLYDWIRDVSRRSQYVGYHVLQTNVIPAELKFYETYWISQFPNLLNARLNDQPATRLSDAGRNALLAIKSALALQRLEDAK